MSTFQATPVSLMTAQQFAERPDQGYPEELVRGRIVPTSVPAARHGQICGNAYFAIRSYVDAQDLGHVVSNDSAVITERAPDTVRGADVAFYSYTKVPQGPLPNGYLTVMPDLIVEVVSPTDRWPKVLAKVVEYLDAGVTVVIFLDDERKSAQVFDANGPSRNLGPDDELTVPPVFTDFRFMVRRFFE